MQFHITTLLDYFIVRWRKQETMCPVMSFLWISCNYELLSLCLSSIHVINLSKSWHRNKSSCAWTCCTVENNVSGRDLRYIPAYERVRRWKRNIFPYIFRLTPRVSALRVHACVIDRCRVLLRRAACAVTCRVTRRKWRHHERTFKNHTRVDMYLTCAYGTRATLLASCVNYDNS